LRLRYKVLLINSAAALMAAVVLSLAYASTRSVAQGYLLTLEEVVPKARALDGLRSALVGVLGSTHELALLGLDRSDSTTSFREIEADETDDLHEAIADFWTNIATYQLRTGKDPEGQALAVALLDAGREVLTASDALLARLPVIDRGTELMAACQRLKTAEGSVLARLREARDHERDAASTARSRMSVVIERSVRMQVLAVVITLVLVAGAGLAVAGTVVRPLGRLTEATERIASGEFELGELPRRRDEIGRLLDSFRHMAAELAASHAHARHLALHDSLTGLPNRVLLAERLGQSLAQSRRYGGAVAVLALDLDRFKGVNDTLGHGAGDRLLREVAARLQACVRETDTVARVGGDEFVLVQLGAEQPAAAEALCRRLRDTLSAPVVIEGKEVAAGVSIGVALAPTDGEMPDDLVRHADIALYQAKHDGRGRFRFFEERMNAALQARSALERDLRQALAENRLELRYQPQVDLGTGRMIGAEALLRWNHPQRGEILPGAFIPLAEETGLILPIGDWVLRTACAEAADWPRLRVAVNISPVQFREPGLIATVEEALRRSGLAPDRLELKITESVLLEDSEAAVAILRALKSLGVRIAMDDFAALWSRRTRGLRAT
jgi:diguanylate cyclase (GGDEF)-like protein